MDKTFITVEYRNGTVVGPARILFADKLRLENTAKHNQWPLTDGFRTQSFLAYAALERSGLLSDTTYQAFLDELADIEVSKEGPGEDPTTAAHAAYSYN